MLLGVDMDEVLADFINSFLAFHNKKYNTDIRRNDAKTYYLTDILGEDIDNIMKKMHLFYNTHDFKNMALISGSKESITQLSKNHEMAVITARPTLVKNDTEKWLNLHFPNKFSSLSFANRFVRENEDKQNKSEICKSLGVELMIEDSLEYATDCANAGIAVLMLDCPWNQTNDLPINIKRVFSWKEILENIN